MVELLSGPWGPVLIFLFRMADVSLATVRVLIVVRGTRGVAPLIGFVEILIWVLAAGAAIQNLHSPLHVVGYAAGFAAGTSAGMWLEGKLALGLCTVRAISTGPQEELAARLREAGFGITTQTGAGLTGPVGLLYAVVRRRQVPAVIRLIEEEDPDAFVTVQNDAAVRRGWLGTSRRR